MNSIQTADSATLDSITLALNETDEAALRQAYAHVLTIHGETRRPTHELYADHALAVALELANLGLDDSDTLVAALLLDTLQPHSGLKEEELTATYGAQITGLIKGAISLDDFARRASLGKMDESRGLEEQGDPETLEAIRRALLSIMEGDIRVILLRMADCLQDLRMAKSVDPDLQFELAYEAIHIYAPLANRLGVWHLKWQLEDLAFYYLAPQQYQKIAGKLDERRAERARKLEQAKIHLEQILEQMGLEAFVTGRPKHIYSIYRKMMRKQLGFDQIHDIQALRVIIQPADSAAYEAMTEKGKNEADRSVCYLALGAVHSLWQPIRREFDDYIASPKANGYRSLHTAVIDSQSGQKLEVQIRSQRMHEEAERGIAAHWAYKEQGMRVSASAQKRIENLRELLATIQDIEDSDLTSAIVGDEKADERIHVFTPNGDVVDMQLGSTPIDFAYQIHTEIGNRCRGARINGKMVSLDYRLQSGDRVEIITSKRGGPNRDWMNPSFDYSNNARTRSKIRQWFRRQDRSENIEQGRSVIDRELKRLGLSDKFTAEQIAEVLHYDDVDRLLADIGFGDVHTIQITGSIAVLQQGMEIDDEDLAIPLRPLPSRGGKGLTVKGVSGLHTRMAGCCNPIPPEAIIGFITRGQGVTIHRQDCNQMKLIDEPERLIEVDWGSDSDKHAVPIVLEAYRRNGLIEELVSVLRGKQINVPTTKLLTNENIMTVYLVAEVNSLQQLNWLMTKLESVPNVIEVRRQRWS